MPILLFTESLGELLNRMLRYERRRAQRELSQRIRGKEQKVPTINKQTPNARQVISPKGTTPAPTSRAGSVLSRAVPVSELEQSSRVKMILYGQNRTGKTTLACQFPKPLLLVSFEPAESGGASSVRKTDGVTFLRIDKATDADTLAAELADDTTYRSHVWDGVSNLERMHLADVLGVGELTEQLGRQSHGGITRDQYTERTERMKNTLRRFLNLQANTVVICREKDHSPPKDQFTPRILRGLEVDSFFASDLSGAAVGWLHDACDCICRLYVAKETEVTEDTVKVAGKEKTVRREQETGRLVRRLLTTYHINYAAGIRSCDPSTVPEYIEAHRPEEMYERLMAVIRGEGTDT